MRRVTCATTGEVVFSYRDYLKTAHWQKVKEKFWASPHCKRHCFVCGMKDDHRGSIHIHHRSYMNIGREFSRDLVELCGSCHEQVHVIVNSKKVKMADICFAVEYLKHQRKTEANRKSKNKKTVVKLIRVV